MTPLTISAISLFFAGLSLALSSLNGMALVELAVMGGRLDRLFWRACFTLGCAAMIGAIAGWATWA